HDTATTSIYTLSLHDALPISTLLAATLTSLSWDYFFTEPRYSLRIIKAGDAMMFLTYFVIALAMAHLAGRLRAQQAAERRREQRDRKSTRLNSSHVAISYAVF